MKELRKFSIYTIIMFIVSMMFLSCEESEGDPNISSADEGVVIDGIRWATRNIAAPGTFAVNPEDAGMLYQWDTIVGWSATNQIFGDTIIKDSILIDIEYATSSNLDTAWLTVFPDGAVTSWSDTYSDTHVGTDVVVGDTIQWATSNTVCPDGWRLPTKDELKSLINSGYKWTTVNGVEGCVFGSGDNAIFFPAVGYRSSLDGSLLNESMGYYWGKDQIGGTNHHLFIQDGGVSLGNEQRILGDALSLRCVKDE